MYSSVSVFFAQLCISQIHPCRWVLTIACSFLLMHSFHCMNISLFIFWMLGIWIISNYYFTTLFQTFCCYESMWLWYIYVHISVKYIYKSGIFWAIDYAFIYLEADFTRQFYKVIGQFIASPVMYEGISYSTSSHTLVTLLFNFSHSVACFEMSLHVFNVMSLTTNNIEHLFIGLMVEMYIFSTINIESSFSYWYIQEFLIYSRN